VGLFARNIEHHRNICGEREKKLIERQKGQELEKTIEKGKSWERSDWDSMKEG